MDHLIDTNKYRSHIRYLLANQHLSTRPLPPSPAKSCCFGTTVYLIGAAKRVKSIWQAAGNQLDNFSDAMGNFVCIPDNNGPGYLGYAPMEMLLKTLLPSHKKPGAIMGFFWESPDCEQCSFSLHHTAMYLGTHNGEDYMFAQEGEGRNFIIETLQAYKKGLSEASRNTFQVRYYEPL